MRNIWKGMLAFSAMIMMIAATGTETKAAAKVKKVKVESNYGTMVHVATGKKVKLTTTVTVTPNKKANKKVTYTSSNKKIATVSASGYVKGVKTGSCKITVKSKKNSKKKATIKVKVVKKVTSVTLNMATADVQVGNTIKLKATVLPATGSYKKVKWSTANKKVAKVSSAGKVTGVAAGTVTIKATSVEGSKKVAKCKVRVLSEDSVNLTSVQVLSKNSVRITLDKAKTLTADAIKVEGKHYSKGNYIRQYEISNIRNYDNKTYDLTLGEGHEVEADSFVRVTIESLPGNGTKSLEVQAMFAKKSTPKTENWVGVVGDTVDKTYDLSEYCYGNISYKVVGSVDGITWTEKNNIISFSGTYKTVTVGTMLTLQATDEMGNVVTKKLFVVVGNESTVVASAEDMTLLVGETIEEKEFVKAAGGSGNYTWDATNLPKDISVNESGAISGTAIQAGTYDVQVTVKDKENEERVATIAVVIKVEEPKTVSGTVVDAKGAPVAKAEVVCENLREERNYITQTDEKGNYTLLVPEGAYNIHTRFAENTDSVYNIVVSTGGRQINFVVNVEK